MLPSYFLTQKALQNPSETVTIRSLLNSGFGDAVELLLHISIVLQSTYQQHFLLFLFLN